jgi:hypothetical protein|tara:strand:+ start:332 stop:634 length:303 start_codon:yes stop_codon:yes gene_type:complete
MASYSNTSPWKNTKIVNRRYLNHFEIRPVPAESDDVLYVIEAQYTHRPDLLAYDLYGTPKLWWVFAQRNMDSIKDPVYDIEAGLEIYLPKGPALKQMLGI